MATTAGERAKKPDVKNAASDNAFWRALRRRVIAAAHARMTAQRREASDMLAMRADKYLKREIRAAEERIAGRRKRRV